MLLMDVLEGKETSNNSDWRDLGKKGRFQGVLTAALQNLKGAVKRRERGFL